MKVYINGNLHEEISNITFLQELLTDLQIQCKKDGKVLQLMVDGKAVNELYPGQLLGGETIEVETNSPTEIVIEGMIESVQYLPALIEGLNQSVANLREGNTSQGIALFSQGIEGLNWLHHVLVGMDLYILSMETFEGKAPIYQQEIEGFNRILKELLSGWENDDYVLISDLVEYELQPVLKNCQQHFTNILNYLAGVE